MLSMLLMSRISISSININKYVYDSVNEKRRATIGGRKEAGGGRGGDRRE